MTYTEVMAKLVCVKRCKAAAEKAGHGGHSGTRDEGERYAKAGLRCATL